MSTYRIALANLPYPSTPEESVALAVRAIEEASSARAGLICFPECYVPGYRGLGHVVAPPDAAFLERAWCAVADAARRGGIGVALGTEKVAAEGLRISVLV